MLIIKLSAIVALFFNAVTAKIFTKCELAKELSEIHGIPSHEIGTYVCIAERQSGLNTKLVGQGLYYGMYQVSSEFWCDSYGHGKECNLNCNKLLDDDIKDDLRCIRTIIEEHQRFSGNGFNAWPSGASCQSLGNSYISECSIKKSNSQISSGHNNQKLSPAKKAGKGKIFDKCELAKALKDVYGIATHEIGTYVCIAQHQSGLNTQAIGEGLFYGMYQLSSEFWCETYGRGKACNLNCNDLLDDNLSDDLQCMRTIINEHQRLSGNGFNAWPSGASCQSQGNSFIADCSAEYNKISTSYNNNYESGKKVASAQRKSSGNVGTGKVYERCELARELRYSHGIPMEHIATWVCIVKHESNYNTSAIGRLNWDGSEDHGLFQISDIYWCGPNDGKGCGLSCDDLKDNDITNDVDCIKTIHTEHTRLSGDGFTAWAVYPRCKGQSDSYIDGCFDDSDNEIIPLKPQPGVHQPNVPNYSSHHKTKPSVGTGRVYDRCELARELRDTHNIPSNQIATWVCIAKHESNFNTSAIGRLNWDGSEDHGLFQISDIYWCGTNGKSCNAQCSEFEDNDISDDVDCIKRIHEEHTRLSGDGFNAWTVYKPKCKGRSDSFIKGCFDDSSNEILPFKPKPGIQYSKPSEQRKTYGKVPGSGKVYEKCELAQELRYKHKIPMEQVATWVCIAKHESNFNTSAIGRLNWDGSEDHGLFQISDIYWCSPPGQGKGCGLSCAELEDNDITDDVECMLKIFEEHTFLSGDGFTAWAVYRPHCQGKSTSYINECFTDDKNGQISTVRPAITQPSTTKATTTTRKLTTTATRPKSTTSVKLSTTTSKSTTIAKSSTFKTVPTAAKTVPTTLNTEPSTTAENSDTTLFDATTATETVTEGKTTTKLLLKSTHAADKKSSTSKSVNSFSTAKPFSVFDLYFNSFPKSKLSNNEKSIVDKPSTSKSQSTKSYSSTTTKQPNNIYKQINDQKGFVAATTKSYRVPSSTLKYIYSTNLTNINLKNPTTKKSIAQTKRTSPITTTKARNSITQTTQRFTAHTTSKPKSIQPSTKTIGITVQPFNVYSHYLIDFTSKATPINYKPIQFSDKSTVIFKKSDKYVAQTEKLTARNDATTASPYLNRFASIWSNGINQKGKMTPHSIEYLLSLTTPRTIYG